MTDNEETVAVPVELLEALKWEGRLPFSLREYLPKPKPRLVAVTRNRWENEIRQDWFESQPDLLTLLDHAVDSIPTFTQESRDLVKARMRTALGVKGD